MSTIHSTAPETYTTRNADISVLRNLLMQRQIRKLDFVASARSFRASAGKIDVDSNEVVMNDSGVTKVGGLYVPTNAADDDIATKLGIPVGYHARTRASNLPLYDAQVNGWLSHPQYDGKKYLLRTYRADDSGEGVLRALLSDEYRPIDDWDVLVAAMLGIAGAGVKYSVDTADLSERRMYVRVSSEEVRTLAPALLHNYRSPWREGVERPGDDIDRLRALAQREHAAYDTGAEPVVFAGFVISNSEVGHGAFDIRPQVIVQICTNGLTINADAQRMVHHGAKLDEGAIKWSDDTQKKSLALVTAKVRDSVKHWLSPDYLNSIVAKIEEKAGKPVNDVQKVVKVVAKAKSYTDAEADAIFDLFIRGGQPTAGGVANAVTAYAQTVADPDRAYAIQTTALDAMSMAATL